MDAINRFVKLAKVKATSEQFKNSWSSNTIRFKGSKGALFFQHHSIGPGSLAMAIVNQKKADQYIRSEARFLLVLGKVFVRFLILGFGSGGQLDDGSGK